MFVAGHIFSFLSVEETLYFDNLIVRLNRDIDMLVNTERAAGIADLANRGLLNSSLEVGLVCDAEKSRAELKREATWLALEQVASVFGAMAFPNTASEYGEVDGFNCQKYPNYEGTIDSPCPQQLPCL